MTFFGKTTVSTLERIALAVVTCWLPLVLSAAILLNLFLNLVEFYAPERFHLEEWGTDPLIANFRLSALVGLLISGSLVVFVDNHINLLLSLLDGRQE